MIFERHRAVAECLIRELEGVPTTPCLHAAAFAGQSLGGVLGWSPPSWSALANGNVLSLAHQKSLSQERVVEVGNTKQPRELSRDSETRICSPGWMALVRRSFVERFLGELSDQHEVLLRRISRLEDVQSASLLFALVRQLDDDPHTPNLQAVACTARELTGILHFEPPTWSE